MRTSKPFATISYNSDEFLSLKLDDLVSRGVIDFWCFVNHLPEIDESKSHKHLYVVPSKLFETSTLIDYLREFDPLHPDKPLGCISCRSSRFDDWYLYSIHDKSYLSSKGQFRKYFYTLDDFHCSNDDYFCELRHQIDYSKLNRTRALIEAINNGETFASLVESGQIPLQLINQYSQAYYLIRDQALERADRVTHTPKEDFTDETP